MISMQADFFSIMKMTFYRLPVVEEEAGVRADLDFCEFTRQD